MGKAHHYPLAGEGADELFLGYAHLVFDALGSVEAAPALGGVHLPCGEGLPLAAIERVLGTVPTFLRAKATLGHRLHSLLSDEYRQAMQGHDAFACTLAGLPGGAGLIGRPTVEQGAYLWTKLALSQYILRTLGDGTEMAHSIEGRLPFLDTRVCELALRLPSDLKICAGQEKWILRQAVRPYVSSQVQGRAKHPLMAPPLFGRSRPIDARLLDVIHGAGFRSVPFFDRGRIAALVERLPTMTQAERTAWDPALMLVLSAALLHERFQLAC